MLRSLAKLRKFGFDRRGVAALEFALIAPILILLYFGVGELCEAMMAQRRTAHATSAIGDLTTQSTTLAPTDVSDIFSAASTIMQPFSTTTLQLRLSSVTVDATKTLRVDWSCGQNMTPLGANTIYTGMPVGLIATNGDGSLVVGDSVVVAEGQYAWASPAQYVLPNGLNFSEIFFLKPRKSSQVTLSTIPAGCT